MTITEQFIIGIDNTDGCLLYTLTLPTKRIV